MHASTCSAMPRAARDRGDLGDRVEGRERVRRRAHDDERDVVAEPLLDRRAAGAPVGRVDRHEVELEAEVVRGLVERGVHRDRGDDARHAAACRAAAARQTSRAVFTASRQLSVPPDVTDADHVVVAARTPGARSRRRRASIAATDVNVVGSSPLTGCTSAHRRRRRARRARRRPSRRRTRARVRRASARRRRAARRARRGCRLRSRRSAVTARLRPVEAAASASMSRLSQRVAARARTRLSSTSAAGTTLKRDDDAGDRGGRLRDDRRRRSTRRSR